MQIRFRGADPEGNHEWENLQLTAAVLHMFGSDPCPFPTVTF